MDKHQARKSLSELCGQLQKLESEVQSVTEQVKALVEETWTVYSEEIYKKLCEWQQGTDSSEFYCFFSRNSVLEYKPTLSSTGITHHSGLHSPFNEPEIFNAQYSNQNVNLAGMIALAFSGHEMQFDFNGQTAVLPFVFWDRVVGIFIAKIPSLNSSQYEKIIQKSASLLADLRAIVLSETSAHGIHVPRAS